MTPEGMVHALQEIRRLLRGGGVLIDIHPVQEAWRAEVHRGGRVLSSEPWRDHDYIDEDVRHADDALAQAVEHRLFLIEGRGEFDFLTYASSPAELRDYLATEGAYDESPDDEAERAAKAALYARVEQTWQASGEGAEVVRRERARIARLRPLWEVDHES